MFLTLLSGTYEPAAATLTYQVTLLNTERSTERTFEREPLTALYAPCEYAETIHSLNYDPGCYVERGKLPRCGPIGKPISLLFVFTGILFEPPEFT